MLHKIPKEIIEEPFCDSYSGEDLYVSTDQVVALEKRAICYGENRYELILSNKWRVKLKFNSNISIEKFIDDFNYCCSERYCHET